MAYKAEITKANGDELHATLHLGKKDGYIRCEPKFSKIYKVYIVLLGILCILSLIFSFDDKSTGQSIGLIIMLFILLGYVFPWFLYTVLPVFKRLFFNFRKISLVNDVVSIQSWQEKSTVTSKARVAGRLGAAAMAGAVRKQGKRAGANFWLGLAALTPSNKTVLHSGATLVLADGSVLSLSASPKAIQKVVGLIDPIEERYLPIYLRYVRDIQQNGQKCIPEVQKKISEIESRVAGLSELSLNGESMAVREKAQETLFELSEEYSAYDRVLKYAGVLEE